MLRKLFAIVVLGVLVAGGVYFWRHAEQPLEAPGSLAEVGDRLKDAALRGAVEAALGLNGRLAPHEIRVEASDGIVTLRGRLPSPELAALAAQVAAAVPEVRRVESRLEVDPAVETPQDGGRSLGESLDDHALALRVKLAFSLNRELDGSDLEISVYRREVTLGGRAESESQRRLAVGVTQDTAGVESVVDRIRVGDAAVTPAVAAARALEANPHLAAYEIEVVEEGGRIVLTGEVGSGAERDLAGLLARQASDRPVDNRLSVTR